MANCYCKSKCTELERSLLEEKEKLEEDLINASITFSQNIEGLCLVDALKIAGYHSSAKRLRSVLTLNHMTPQKKIAKVSNIRDEYGDPYTPQI